MLLVLPEQMRSALARWFIEQVSLLFNSLFPSMTEPYSSPKQPTKSGSYSNFRMTAD
ncbi:Uncharacterised protein [Klebsiella pneumoniae]|uniref:Uncharacterized protein n=1 Tax=Klebsiella pneumoniae TaxID=573 RepID=A0A378FZ90_KLEPN|nr:Uncharacterised protein [Klebsiella pneumoniae]STW49119.1 Uncharacterised protein [Klebsiella pneumoniae]SWC84936.1 Uncharacterised protein [Klebsiella pneumoniae]SXJ68497.1 Uncharacterised protein [Klebsiella pneumoniae]VCW23769.1 hypothetical protein BANRA_04547 [Klebsiella pneumoniae]